MSQNGTTSRQSQKPPIQGNQSRQSQAVSRNSGASAGKQSQTGANQPASMSESSPVPPISRTPTADRNLLRTLTVSPTQDGLENGSPEPGNSAESPQSIQARSTQQSRNSKQSTARSPTVNSQSAANSLRTATRESDRLSAASRASGLSMASQLSEGDGSEDPTLVKLPPAAGEVKTDAWQANKTMAEANNHMLKYEIASDVTFEVGENKEAIRAHKFILMARSPVLFKTLIRHSGNNDVRIPLPDISPENFRDLLTYLYTDEFDIHTDNVTFMLYAAKKFQLTGLTQQSFQYLDAEMHDDTVCRIMEQAHTYNETNLYEKCVRYILTNGNAVLRKPDVAELCPECLSRIIKADELRAEEEAVFEACNTWAMGECRKKRRQATDENKRKALGKLLYLIRFPVMDVQYFTQKVSLGKLLSHDEVLSIFQFFHGEEQQLPNKFSRNERNRVPRDVRENLEPIMLASLGSPTSQGTSSVRVHRFGEMKGTWKQNGPADAISFEVSNPIVLLGVEIYGAAYGKEAYDIRILVYDDITRDEIRKNDINVFTSNAKQTYEVYLARPLRVPPKRVFTIVIIMKGPPANKGCDGEKKVTVDNVTFTFSNSNKSPNGTDVTVGQIPALIFNKTQ